MKQRGKSVYIIAEIGINHNGSLENCLRMIEAAEAAGCNAVKFQFFKADSLYPRSAGFLDWADDKKRYRYDIHAAVKQFELPETWVDRIVACCAALKIDFLSSVFDASGVKFLVSKGMKKIKLSSYTVTNIPLVTVCASYRLPLIVSTGGATLGEIESAVRAITSYHSMISLLHCSIKYPTDLKDCNLGVIETLRYAFPDSVIGYSDHTMEVSDAAVQAVYLGARIIEKHITLDKAMKGPDHFFAVEPGELARLVRDIRSAESAIKKGRFAIDKRVYGSTAKVVYGQEKYLRDFAFMRLFAKKSMRKGQVIRPADIAILRPGKKKHGLEPSYLSLFDEYRVTAKKAIRREDPIGWDSILT